MGLPILIFALKGRYGLQYRTVPSDRQGYDSRI